MQRLLLILLLTIIAITGCSTDKKSSGTESPNTDTKTEVNIDNTQNSEKGNTETKEKEAIPEGTTVEHTNDYFFPQSDKVKLTQEDIYNIESEKLELARNEIYARRGYIFKAERFSKYFSKKEWYNPREDFKTAELTSIEMYNIKLISYFESLNEPYEANKITVSEEIRNIDIFPRGKEVNADLNGDGIEEKILYKTNGEDASYGNACILFVNEQEIKLEGSNFFDSFAIADIDKTDNIKEIVISDDGPSGDPISEFFYYDGKKTQNMGSTEGLYDCGIKISGKGVFSAISRAEILHTWWFERLYKLDLDHKIIEIEQDVLDTNYSVFLKKPLKLYVSRDSNSDSFTIKEGTVVNLAGTDNKEWCLIRTKDGKKGWFAIESFDEIKGSNLNAREFFIGLCYAD
ncbi:YARHG domain-containing protein [Wukongibacter baidiensis]